MNGPLTAKLRARELTAAVGDHLIYVHVELRATPRHPHMQRKHVLMLTCKNLVAGLDDELVPSLFEPSACVVRICCGLLQGGVRGDHFSRDQILPDIKVFE